VRHWHIDYFKPAGVIKEIWYTTYPVPREHDWARIILSLPGAQIPLKRFGATDCTCPTHLIYFASRPNVKVCAAAMQAHFEDADFHSLIIPES
jgi:Uri superfamily endonuclease